MRKIFVSIAMIFSSMSLLAQNDRIDSLLSDVFGNDKLMSHLFDQYSKQSFIFSGLTMENRTFYAGREIGDNMFSLTGHIYMFHSGGIYFGASGSWFSQIDPRYNATAATIGIRKPLNRKNTLNFRASFSRFFFNSDDSVTYGPNSNNLGLGLMFNKTHIGSRLSFNLLFGNETKMIITPSVFSKINIARFKRSGKILLSPEISAFIGPEIVYEPTNSDNAQNSTFITTEKYGLINIQLSVPIAFQISGFGIEAGYSVNIPMTQDSYVSYPANSYFSVSIGHTLSLNKKYRQ
jgi:hypothetical protein